MILANEGTLNSFLDVLGIISLGDDETIHWLASNGAVFCVMVYAYILFMVFPVYNTIETLDPNQIEAAKDLGASTLRTHLRVVLPHAKPGIAVGSIMTFMLAAGSIAVPGLVGPGLHSEWFSQVIYRNFFEAGNWNSGSAYSLALLAAYTTLHPGEYVRVPRRHPGHCETCLSVALRLWGCLFSICFCMRGSRLWGSRLHRACVV